MLRPRPLATVIAAFALLGFALFSAPIGATQSAAPTLSPTPPVRLAPPSTPAPTTTTPAQPERLPKTGLDLWLVGLAGLGLLGTGAALRRALAGSASRGDGSRGDG